MPYRFPQPSSAARLAALAIAIAAAGASGAENADDGQTFEEHIQPLVAHYCYRCHGEGEKLKGDIDLTRFKTAGSVLAERKLWLEALDLIRSEEMPTKSPLPTREERRQLVAWLDQQLNDIDWSQVRDAGHVTIPRLNKTEYNNTMRDLLGIDLRPGDTFLEDGEGQSGFTNDRDNLFLTPDSMEKYFAAAARALDALVALDAAPVERHLESEDMLMTETREQPKEFGNDFRGYVLNRGQMTLYESVEFPFDGQYTFTVRALPSGGPAAGARLRINDEVMGDIVVTGTDPSLQTITCFVSQGAHQIAWNIENPKLPPAPADPQPQEATAPGDKPNKKKKKSPQAKAGSIAIDWIEVRGPLKPAGAPERSAVFIARPEEAPSPRAATERVIARFVQRAFRRPVAKAEIDRYLGIYDEASRSGQDFTAAVKLALTGILVSPNFLFRHEFAPAGIAAGEFALDDFQIASRLSYFLWLSMPDSELFGLAREKRLHDPEVLRAQVRRMLRDPKARSFTSAFLGQWLGFESLGVSVIPDEKLFPQFDAELAAAMKQEAVLAFEHLLTRDHSLLELLDSRATFLNARLARHYGIAGIEGEAMRPVALSQPERGGLLGMASVLTATSSPTRTSPVLRGKWVVETLLGGRIPDPPPDAGQLDANAGQKKGKTLREELEFHRSKSECASCHDKIDPIGFGLENFDAIGRFRSRENGKEIDSSGELDGFRFTGAAELKAWLVKERRDAFVRNVTERLLAFALGRELATFDEGPLREIIAALEADGYLASRLVEEIVLSYPFLNQNLSRPEHHDE